ncbi:hypothetical protein SLA2020_397470 [Shorea laevis]
MIASKTAEELSKFLDDWVKNPWWLGKFSSSSNTMLLAGSSRWFNVYGNDFGWGRPVAVRSGTAQLMGS